MINVIYGIKKGIEMEGWYIIMQIISVILYIIFMIKIVGVVKKKKEYKSNRRVLVGGLIVRKSYIEGIEAKKRIKKEVIKSLFIILIAILIDIIVLTEMYVK